MYALGLLNTVTQTSSIRCCISHSKSLLEEISNYVNPYLEGYSLIIEEFRDSPLSSNFGLVEEETLFNELNIVITLK